MSSGSSNVSGKHFFRVFFCFVSFCQQWSNMCCFCYQYKMLSVSFQAFHIHQIDQTVQKHRVQQIIPERLERLERLPYHYQVKIERKFYIIIGSMIIVVAIVLAPFHAIHNIINARRSYRNHHPIHNYNTHQMRNQNHSIQPNVIQTITRQRALPIASFQMTCKIVCHLLRNFEAQLKQVSRHHRALPRHHDWGKCRFVTEPNTLDLFWMQFPF